MAIKDSGPDFDSFLCLKSIRFITVTPNLHQCENQALGLPCILSFSF